MGRTYTALLPSSKEYEEFDMNSHGCSCYDGLISLLNLKNKNAYSLTANGAKERASIFKKALKNNRLKTCGVEGYIYFELIKTPIFKSKKSLELKKSLHIDQIDSGIKLWLEELIAFLENCGGYETY